MNLGKPLVEEPLQIPSEPVLPQIEPHQDPSEQPQKDPAEIPA
jgi:hypothetical protein